MKRIVAQALVASTISVFLSCEVAKKSGALLQYAQTFSEDGLSRDIVNPYIRDKVIAIERPAGEVAELHYYLMRQAAGPTELPQRFRASAPDEIGTVLLLDRALIGAGTFTDGSNAYRQAIVMTIVDASTRTIVGEVAFVGDAPLRRVGSSSRGTGAAPDRDQMVSYVAGLPQWNAELALNIDLLRAARDGDASKVQQLVAKGASLDARAVGPASTAPFSSLERAQLSFEASEPHLPRVPADERIPVVPRQVKADRTSLMVAASGGHLAVVQTLLKLGADVNAVDGEGQTALMFAKTSGKPDVVRALIEAGAQR